MNTRVVQDRLNQYQPANQIEEENAIKEITQEIALSGLSRAGFFKSAVFQGGSCLRILYGLNRFSEDLDFALQKPDPAFDLSNYLSSLQGELASYGYKIDIQDRSKEGSAVKAGFLKDDSIGKVLTLRHPGQGTRKSIRIKLEVDTNPPEGAQSEQKYIDFPVTVPILVHDLPSLFASKSHAILCRPWPKGRDWFDFVWYVGRKVTINYDLLSAAIEQAGPWKGQGIRINKAWFLERLREKILFTDWQDQKEDVVRFLKQSDLDLLNTWGAEFFLDRISVLAETLSG